MNLKRWIIFKNRNTCLKIIGLSPNKRSNEYSNPNERRKLVCKGHWMRICLIVKTAPQEHNGAGSFFNKWTWVRRLWPILSRVRTTSSRLIPTQGKRHGRMTGLISNNLLAGLAGQDSCQEDNSFFEINGKTCSGMENNSVTGKSVIACFAAISTCSFSLMPIWLGIHAKEMLVPWESRWKRYSWILWIKGFAGLKDSKACRALNESENIQKLQDGYWKANSRALAMAINSAEKTENSLGKR